MKVIFLDYDGVINRTEPPTPTRVVDNILVHSDQELVFIFNKLVDDTEAEIVLSSSWRHLPDWREAMKQSGVVKNILDRTPRYADHKKLGVKHDELCRGHNIQQWLNEHEDIEKYAIIDDNADMLPGQMANFFKTDTRYGLTDSIARNIRLHLSK